jgi:hypothetical protein
MNKKILIYEFQDIRFATRAKKEAYSLSKQYRVTLLGFNRATNKKQKRIIEDIEYIEYPIAFKKRKGFIIKLIQLFFFNIRLFSHLMKNKYDLYFMHNLKTFMPSVFIRSITKKPLIYDSHELQLGKREKNKFRTAFLNFIDKKKEKFLIKKANLIIQASTERAVFFSKYYKTTLPLVIENFAKFKSKTNLKKSIYDDVPKNKDTVLGVFTGNITIGGNQEIENLIFAYQNLTDNIHLCLLGNIGEDTKKYIITLVKKLKIDNRVHILKPVLSEEVVSYISEADFAIIPIYNKTLNSRFSALNKVSESLMAGLALMASNNLNLRNLIYGNPYGKIGECFDVDNVEDIATKITEGVSFIQKNKSTVKNRIEKLSKETYNWEKQEEKLFSAIEKVLN